MSPVPALRPRGVGTAMLLIDGEPLSVAGPDAGRVDLALVERLARLTLEVRRRGGSVCLYDPSPELLALLELCGLADLLLECRGGTC
jgi:hypothetical protein